MRSFDLGFTRRNFQGSVAPQSLALAALASVAYWWAILPVIVAAIRAACGARLPAPLAHVLTKLPTAFPVHMAASAGALALVPLIIATYRMPALHRPLGKIAVACIIVGGATSLAVASQSTATLAAKCGFAAQGLAWVALTIAGIYAIRRRRVQLHRRLMTAVAIITISPVALRILMHLAIAKHLPFGKTYAMIAWTVWLVPLAIYALSCSLISLLGRTPASPCSPL